MSKSQGAFPSTLMPCRFIVRSRHGSGLEGSCRIHRFLRCSAWVMSSSSLTHVGYQWVYLDPLRNVVFYNDQPGRSEMHPANMLKGFKGIEQTDGFAGENKATSAPEINQIYCMAHARRYFKRAGENGPERAEHFLKEVQKLCEIERAIKDHQITGEEKMKYRTEQALPILMELKTWLDDQVQKIAPKSTIGKAVFYTKQRWKGLMAYCQCDYTEFDNGPVERSIRPMVVGRKNYLFSGANESAERAACYSSFFITCRLHNVNPKAWIMDVFEKIEHLKPSHYHTLFPQNWGK